MRGVYEIPAYRPGKRRSRRKGFVPADSIGVVAVEPWAVRRFLGLRGQAPTTRVLRALAREGILLRGREGDRLTRGVRVELPDGRVAARRMYVFRAEAPHARMAEIVRGAPPNPDGRPQGGRVLRIRP